MTHRPALAAAPTAGHAFCDSLYDDLNAREAAKAVGRLGDADEVRAVRDHERAHRDRKTVLERADRTVD